MEEAERCFICNKHQTWPGPLRIHADGLGVVTHASGDSIYHGYLYVEPHRHAAGWEDLNADEAAHLGRLLRRASLALRTVGCDHVYAFVYGDGVPHLHVHLIGRWPDAPADFRTVKTADWPQAPRSPLTKIGSFTQRLRTAFDEA